MSMGKKIKMHRNRLGLSQEELGAKVGVNKAAVQKWERGTVQNIKRNNIEILAGLFDISPSELMWGNEIDENDEKLYKTGQIKPISVQKVPLLGSIAAGQPILADESFECYVEIGSDIKCDFCLHVKGDSMINARIHDGDIVFIRKQPDVDDGDIAGIIIDGEATLKRVYKSEECITLVAENPKYKPIIISLNETSNIYILGKAVAFQSDVK